MIGMGHSLTTTSIQKKLERMLDLCTADNVFKGTILEFDTISPVPKERLTKGMLVETKEGMRRVNFCASIEGSSGVQASSLNIGDSVIVLGTQHKQRENATLPYLIMLPERQTQLVSKEPPSLQWGGLGDTIQVIFYVFVSILSTIAVLAPLTFPYNWPYWLPLYITLITFFLLFFVIEWHQRYIRRARVFRFDSGGWTQVTAMINSKFDLEL